MRLNLSRPGIVAGLLTVVAAPWAQAQSEADAAPAAEPYSVAAEPAAPAAEPASEAAPAEASAEPADASTEAAPASAEPTAEPQPPAEASTAPAPAEPDSAVIPVQELRAEQPANLDKANPADDDSGRLDTVEVTASYRKENIQDVAGSAHAFGGRALDKAGATGMQDYLVQVPSVSLQKSGNGTARIAMRGISNVNGSDLGYASGSPTTGVYLDDVAIQGSGVFPDLNIYDLARIEVLKGPQGTLYGEGSMGGAIKMITREPAFNEWELRGSLMGARTEQGAPSYDGRIAVNVPLWEDRLGARIVYTQRKTGGFVDYVNLDRPDADEEDAHSLRGLLRWQIGETLQADLLHLDDHADKKQFPVVDEGKQEELINTKVEDQYAKTDFSIDALTLRWTLPFANLTSVSAVYNTDKDGRRRTPVLQNLVDAQYLKLGLGHAPDIFSNGSTRVISDLHSFSQELRLVSFGGERFDWIAGAFYRDRNQAFEQEKREDTVPDFDPTGGLLTSILGGYYPVQGRQEKGDGDETFNQYAGYGELKWNLIPDKFELTGGLRYFSEDVGIVFDTHLYGIEAFLLSTEPSNIDPSTNTARVAFSERIKTSGFLPKLSAAWHFNEDHMVYATVSRGFRSGAANIYHALGSGPPIMRPDYVLNKEIGTKSTWLEGRLNTNLSLYHLDWKDMQGTVLGTAMLGRVPVQNFAHLDNAGDSVAYGAEGSVAWLPVRSLTLLLNAGYNKGHVTKVNEGAPVKQGSSLPNMPELTWSASASYNTELPLGLTGDANVTYAFVDTQNVIFDPEVPKDIFGNDYLLPETHIPSYSLLKANVGAGTGQWRLQLFGDNLLDKRAIVAISGPIAQYTVITPRTLGVRLSYEF